MQPLKVPDKKINKYSLAKKVHYTDQLVPLRKCCRLMYFCSPKIRSTFLSSMLLVTCTNRQDNCHRAKATDDR